MENRFDLYELPEGHEARFEAKLNRRRTRTLVLRWTAAAAGLAALLWIGIQAGSPIGRAHSPEAVYAAYLQQVGGLYELLAARSTEDVADWESVLDELTEETVPLYEQLPDELSRREKTALLKRHYGSILDEARQLKKLNKQ